MPDVGIPATTAVAGHRQGWVLMTLCLGVLIAQVDTSVVNLAIQPIGAAFQASVAGLQWVLDGYNLSYAVLLLSGGLVADLYGRRLVFQVGAALLGLASLACALAPTIGVLVASRVAAGIGAALLLPSSLAIVWVAWPEPRARRHALGVWASCNGLAFAIGPTVGGLLIQHFGWRSVFVLAVPFVLAASVLASWVVPNSADPEGRALDLRGQMLGVLVLGGLVFAAIDGHQGGVAWIWSLSAPALRRRCSFR